MKYTHILYYYIISIFMMANDAFFNWVGRLIHINFWRQLITLIGFYIVYKTLRKKDGLYYIRKVYRQYGKMFQILGIFSIITIVVNGYSLLQVVYALWLYSFGLPFLLFPYYARRCGWSEHKFNMFFIFLGTFLSVGILIDFLSGGFFTSSFISEETIEEGLLESGRFCFLSSAPTIFTVYYCFCLSRLFKECMDSRKTIIKVLLLCLSLLFVFGSIFCGSRQTLAGLFIVEAIGLLNLFKTNKSTIIILGISVSIAYLFLPQAKVLLSENQGFQDRYTAEAIGEDDRTETWKKGFDYCILYPSVRRIFIGDGVGKTAGKAAKKADTGSHFENTFFARISDVGWFMTFWMLLYPVYFIFKSRRKKTVSNLLYYAVIVAFLFICMVSPNGATGSTQMTVFILLGTFLEDNKME